MNVKQVEFCFFQFLKFLKNSIYPLNFISFFFSAYLFSLYNAQFEHFPVPCSENGNTMRKFKQFCSMFSKIENLL